MEPPCRDELKHLGKIAGWLILPASGMILSVVQAALRTISLGRAVLEGTAPAGSLAWAASYFGSDVVLATFFFCKHRWTPRLYVGVALLNVLLSLVRVVPQGLLGHSGPFGLPRQLVQASAVAAIWVPYFLISVRVKLTFTRSWGRREVGVAA